MSCFVPDDAVPRDPTKPKMADKKKKSTGQAKKKSYHEDMFSTGPSGRNKELIKPFDQEKLTYEQLKEEMIRSLTTFDPLKRKNLVVWDHKERSFVPYEDPEQMVCLYQQDAELLFKDSEEINQYKGELMDEDQDQEPIPAQPQPRKAKGATTKQISTKSSSEEGPEGAEEGSEETAGAQPETPPKTPKGKDDKNEEAEEEHIEEAVDQGPKPAEAEKPKKLLNQFNYCERSTQTLDNPTREKSCETAPPPGSSYKDYCNQWIIYDAYEIDKVNNPDQGKEKKEVLDPDEADEAMDRQAEEEKKKTFKKDKDKKDQDKEKVKMRKPSIIDGQAHTDQLLLKSSSGLSILERMVAQNLHEDVIEDFMYYEDGADEFRETGEGTVLPLWKFSYDKAKRMHVTGIAWSPSQPDMFVVSFGSYSFVHPVIDGMVVVFSLKNSAYPEHAWLAPKGAMSVDIHPTKSCLIAIGLFDGNVAMLKLKTVEMNTPRTVVLRNIPTEIKHRAAIWSIKWGPDDLDGNPNFYTAGMDGRVIYWKVGVLDLQGLGGLTGSEISTLHLPLPPVTGPDGTSYKLFGCARCVSFHPKEVNTFLVGTAEGNIFRCSTLYGSRFPQIYSAHFLPVAAVQWNYFHSEVFISCSEDWTIKIWDRREPEPMYVFEIGLPILDVAWAPYSSTVFAAVTDEGKVLVYDLNVNKDKPVCAQQIVTKKKVRPHRIAFNPHYPILIVGDDRGHLTTLKLSPNLRVQPKDTRGMLLEGDQKIQSEINKMSKLLSLVRDPESVTNPKHVPGPSGDTTILRL